MLDKGVITSIHYPYHIKSFERFGFSGAEYKKSRALSERCVSLPLYVGMTDNQVNTVIERVNEFFDSKS